MKIPSDINLEDYVEFIGQQESDLLHWAPTWSEQVLVRMKHGEQVYGDCLPWAKTHNVVRLRPGELSIWAGINGHRKSMIIGQVMLWLAKQHRVCIASLEMKPEATIQRMIHQAAGCAPAMSFATDFLVWSDERICIYDALDTVEAVRILGMVHYAAVELGCKHVVIDSLTKCGLATDDYSAQKGFVDQLAQAAKRHNIHVHLVCHMRKGADETRKPGKFDVRGASEITDLADNVFVCWKDKEREQIEKLQLSGAFLDEKELAKLDKPSQLLIVEKQRHGEWEGPINLWFHDQSLQFTPDDRNRPLPFEVAA